MQARITAELIDFFVLIMCKVLVLNQIYGTEGFLTQLNTIYIPSNEDELEDLLSGELEWMIVQALVFRVVVIIYEAYMLSGTLPYSRGVTIGKSIVGLKVVYAEKVEPNDPTNVADMKVKITNQQAMGIKRSTYRSLLKNLAISFLFPML